MSVAKPAAIQILVAWGDNKWVVQRNAVEVAAYAYRTPAMAKARALGVAAAEKGVDCYILVREHDGRWHETPCPKSARRSSSG